MFSGLIQSIGRIVENKGARLSVDAPLKSVRKGNSIAINGVCLTVTRFKKASRALRLDFDLSPETIERTTLRNLSAGTKVNIEAALTMADALGGHIVQGHVDGMGRLSRIAPNKTGATYWFTAPAAFRRYLVSKGSVAIDGVSLTVVKTEHGRFSVALIPYTLEHTTLGALSSGARVNLEADVIAKYVFKYTRTK